MYVNPQFYPGVVISIDGKQSSGSVNICTINQGLYFISPENDTLLVSNQETIDRVYILGRTYVNSKYGFVEMLEAAADVTLCELRLTEIHTDAAPDAYGLRTHTKSSKQLTSYASAAIGNGHEPLSTNPLVNFDINSDFAFSYSKKPFLLVKGEAYIFFQSFRLHCSYLCSFKESGHYLLLQFKRSFLQFAYMFESVVKTFKNVVLVKLVQLFVELSQFYKYKCVFVAQYSAGIYLLQTERGENPFFFFQFRKYKI